MYVTVASDAVESEVPEAVVPKVVISGVASGELIGNVSDCTTKER